MKKIKKEGDIHDENEEYDPKRRLVLYAPDSIRKVLTELGEGNELTPNMMALEIVAEVISKKIPLEILANSKKSINF